MQQKMSTAMACDSNQVDWADQWDNPEYADLTLELTVKDDPAGTKRINAHRVYLQAKSEYLKSRLSKQYDIQDHGPRVESTPAPTKGGKKGRGKKRQKTMQPDAEKKPESPSLILTVECESGEDQAACLSTLQHAYTGKLPPAEDMALITMVCKKADYLRMPATVQACLAALSQLAAQQQLSAELSSQLLSLPNMLPEQLLCNSDSGKALLQQLHAIIPSKFGKTADIMCDKQLQQQFVALPFELLLHWASLEELVTDSENTIAVLMHVWIKQNSLQQPVSSHATEQLSKLLRVGQLSFPFHLHALPKLPWYKSPPELPADHALVRWGYEHCKHLPKEIASAYYWDAKRQTAGSASIEWAISTVQLQEKWASSEREFLQGPSLYYAGYTCSQLAYVAHKEGHKLLGLYLGCEYCPELSAECTGPPCAALSATIEVGKGGSLHHTRRLANGVFFGDHRYSYGAVNVFAHPLPVEGGLQQLMTYRELPIKVTFKMVT